jgi:adenine phosphoribosyltransferase
LPSVADSETWLRRRTPPDYADRQLTLGFPVSRLQPGERVLLVDDWVATGGQALGVQALVADAHATWLGCAVIVDGLDSHQTRRVLSLRSLLRLREL